MTGKVNAPHPEDSEERSFLKSLDSDKKTIVIQAIVQLAKIASSDETLKALQKIAEGKDRELAFFATQAVGRIRNRRGDTLQPEKEPNNDVKNASLSLITINKLVSPTAEEIPLLLKELRSKFDSIPEELRPHAAAFLESYGNSEDAVILTSWLNMPDSGLNIPIIDAITTLAPYSLMAHFPTLLASRHPIVRMKAITALRKIDPQEAEAHLLELLASRKVEERLAAISAAFLFPFSSVKEPILAILAEEEDPEILHGCEIFLASNPEIDTAMRILDLIDTSPQPHAIKLAAIFKTICASMGAAGLISSDKPHEQIIRLRKRERLRKFLSDLEIQISVAPPPHRQAIETWLTQNIQIPEVTSFVEKLRHNPATLDIYNKLRTLLSENSTAADTTKSNSPQYRAEQEKLQIIAKLDKKNWDQHAAWVRDEARFGSTTVRIAAINAIAALSNESSDIPLAEIALNQDDCDIQFAAFKLLEIRDPERLTPYISKFLESPSPELRDRIIEFTLKRDSKTAITAIERMLQSKDRSIRAQAATHLVSLPFKNIVTLLFRTLENEDHPAIARQLINILLANPSKEILEKLDRMKPNANPSITMLISQARTDLFEILSKQGIEATESKTLSDEQTEFGNVTHQKQTPNSTSTLASETATKPYSVAQVRQAIRKRETESKVQAKSESKQSHKDNTTIISLTIGAIIAILAFLPILGIKSAMNSQTSSETVKSKPLQNERREEEKIERFTSIPTNFRMGRPCRLTGKVKNILDKQTFIFESENKTFRCNASEKLPMLLKDQTVSVEMLPYRKFHDGTIGADIISVTVQK